MQTNHKPAQTRIEALNRVKKVYAYFFVAMNLIILSVFFEPTLRRIVEGIWVRGRFNFAWTLSLDIHALVSYAFLLLVSVQVFFGYKQAKRPSFRQSHSRLGYFLFYFLFPAFILANIWVVLDRSLTIPLEESVGFRVSPTFTAILMLEVPVFLTWFTIRGFYALKQRDIVTHVDSILGAFMYAGIVAVLRFLYSIIWATRGTSPLSGVAMGFLSIAVVTGSLALAYYLAGRLRQNKITLLAIIVVTALLAILGSGSYTILDV